MADAALRPVTAHGLGEHGLRVRLDLVVDREADVLPRGLGLRRDDVEGSSDRVLHDRLAARLTGEHAIERALETFEATVVQPRVPEHLRRDALLRVRAKLLRVEAEPAEAELLERLRRVRVDLAGDVDESLRAIRQERVDRGRRKVELLCDRKREVARTIDLSRVREHRGRLLSDRERLAVPVEDGAPTGRHDDRLPVLARRHRRVRVALDDLQPERTRQRGAEKNEKGAGEEGDPPVRGAPGHRARDLDVGHRLGIGLHQPELVRRELLDLSCRRDPRELGAEPGDVGLELRPLLPRPVELDVQAQDRDVHRDDARE